MNILCVCTGNMCRSPMLEYLLKQELPKHGIHDAVVTGAGTDTVDGSAATDHSITVMKEIGIDISAHRSRQMTHAIAEENDVFVVMTPQHGVNLAFYYGVDPEKMAIPGDGVPDPFGHDLNVYRECRDALVESIPQLIEDIKAL